MSLITLVLGACVLAEVCIGQSITPAPTGTFAPSSAQLYMTTSDYASILQLLFFGAGIYGRVPFLWRKLAIHGLLHDIRLRSRWILHHQFRCLNAISNALLGRQTNYRDCRPCPVSICRSNLVRQFSQRVRLGYLRRQWLISRTHGQCRHHCSRQRCSYDNPRSDNIDDIFSVSIQHGELSGLAVFAPDAGLSRSKYEDQGCHWPPCLGRCSGFDVTRTCFVV